MSEKRDLNRREFLKVSAVAGTGLVIGIYLQGCRPEATVTPGGTTVPPTSESEATYTPGVTPTEETLVGGGQNEIQPNIYLRIASDGTVTVTAFRSEMGQGIRTAIAMIVGEELDVDWSKLRVEQAPANSAYGDQVTGGSLSVSRHYTKLRQAGATARQLLLEAAAQTWGVSVQECYTQEGFVLHSDGDRRLAYGELVSTAVQIEAPSVRSVELEDPQDFELINTPRGNFDNAQIVDGSAIFGLDVRLEGMLYACVAMCPVFGGKVASYDANQAQVIPGVRQVLQISSGVAVVAESTWAAMQGKRALQITWDEGRGAETSSLALLQAMTEDAQAQVAGLDADSLGAIYTQPFEAHATMEPMNCTADLRPERCVVWAPTQNPQEAKQVVRSVSGLPGDKITVYVPLIGGGFGRRLQVDYVRQAVELSKAVGAPVKVVWTREDDIQHDFYHPIGVHTVTARRDTSRAPSARSRQTVANVPTGAWRSVDNFHEALARECFLDELAYETGKDALQLRLELLPRSHHAVLNLVGEKSGWGEPLPEGWGRGLACYSTFNATPVAQVADVSVDASGQVRVHRVVCAVECGTTINPDGVKAQMEGGIAFGLTAALKAGITIENGRAKESNFHDYPLLRMDEMPKVEVYIVPSNRDPSGIGEMGVPPAAPAVLNAIFNATGGRVRHIPVRTDDLV